MNNNDLLSSYPSQDNSRYFTLLYTNIATALNFLVWLLAPRNVVFRLGFGLDHWKKQKSQTLTSIKIYLFSSWKMQSDTSVDHKQAFVPPWSCQMDTQTPLQSNMCHFLLSLSTTEIFSKIQPCSGTKHSYYKTKLKGTVHPKIKTMRVFPS